MMKSLFVACGFLFGLQAEANYQIQKFPGKVTIQVDLFERASKPLDILFVVDSSGSMSAFQDRISNMAPLFVDSILNLNRNFHVGVVNMDTESAYNKQVGYLIGSPLVIGSNSPNLSAAIAQSLLVGTGGSGVESPFLSFQTALSDQLLSGPNAGFLRDDGALALVFITDAEDQSPNSIDDTLNFLKVRKGDLSNVTAFSWVVPSNINVSTGCTRDDPSLTPRKIESVTTQLKGAVYNICDISEASFRDFADKISKFNGNGLGRITEVPLTIAPDLSTVQVTYGSEVILAGDSKNGWIYDSGRNVVLLGQGIDWSKQPAHTPLHVTFVPADWQK